jgi:hypothetical protein
MAKSNQDLIRGLAATYDDPDDLWLVRRALVDYAHNLQGVVDTGLAHPDAQAQVDRASALSAIHGNARSVMIGRRAARREPGRGE